MGAWASCVEAALGLRPVPGVCLAQAWLRDVAKMKNAPRMTMGRRKASGLVYFIACFVTRAYVPDDIRQLLRRRAASA